MGQKLSTSMSTQFEIENPGVHDDLNDIADAEWEIKAEIEIEENIPAHDENGTDENAELEIEGKVSAHEIGIDENERLPKFNCNECGISFTTRRGFNKHNFNHHSKDVKKSHKCVSCEKRFATILSLKNHVKAKHDHFDQLYPYKCGCGKSYGTNTHLKRHQLNCHDAKSIDENDPLPPRFKCHKCELTYASNRNLIEHYKYHHGKHSQKLIKCEICNEGFATFNSRHHHMKLKHPNSIPQHKCQKCNKTFSSSSTRSRHEKIHENNCNFCIKSFESRNALDIHKRDCTKKVFLSCGHCQNMYESKDSLARHLKARHYAQLPDIIERI